MQEIAEILDKLRSVTDYRTVPYQTYREGSMAEASDARILDIDPEGEAARGWVLGASGSGPGDDSTEATAAGGAAKR